MRESDNNDISIDQLNKKYIEKRHDIIRVLRLINTRLNFNSQTVFIAISYLDGVVLKCHTITKTSEFLLIGLSCLLIAAKFNENDPNVPEIKKFIVVFCELIKYKYRYRLEDLRIGEIFVLKQLDYKMNYYSIYHYIVFFFAHGLVTEQMLKKHFNDLTQLSSSTDTRTGMKRRKVIKILEQIYVQAREIMDVLLESGEFCVYGRDNYMAAAVILKISIENIFSIDAIPEEDDLLYLVYGINEQSDYKSEEIRRKVKSTYEQRYPTKRNSNKESFDPNHVVLQSLNQNNPIKEKKIFDATNHKGLNLDDYESKQLSTNNVIGMMMNNVQTTKARESQLQDNDIKPLQYELPKKNQSNIESVREELFTITSKIRKRACSSTKDKNKESQTINSNNVLMTNKETLPMKYQSSNQVIANSNTHNIHSYNNYLQQQQQQSQNDILDKTKYIFNQTRNTKKQIILYSGPNSSKPMDNTAGFLYHSGIDTLDSQSPSTIIINNNININIQDKNLSSSSQLLKKGDDQLYRSDLRKSNHYPSRGNNNFGTYYNYNPGNGVSSNQLNYYVMNQNRYGLGGLNLAGNRYGNISNN